MDNVRVILDVVRDAMAASLPRLAAYRLTLKRIIPSSAVRLFSWARIYMLNLGSVCVELELISNVNMAPDVTDNE